MIYPLKPTQKLTVNVSYPHVGIITYADDTTLMYAASNEPNGPVAVAYADNWMQSESGSVFFSNEDTLMRNDSTPVEVLTGITINATSTTFSNMPKGIKSIQMDATLLDFTLAGISAIESASGRSLALTGFASEAEAFAEVSNLLAALEAKHFTLVKDKSIQSFTGRSNRERFKFLMTENDENVPTDNDNHIDFSHPSISKIEVIGNGESVIDSMSDSVKRSNSELLVNVGDLNIPDGINLDLTFVLYVDGDTKGLVLTASESIPTTAATIYRTRPTLADQ